MIAHVPLVCPYCKKKFNVSEAFIDGLLSTMKMNKVLEVAQQMHDKRGPFYDKWLAAMEVRGEQKRCKECLYFESQPYGGEFWGITCRDALYSGGEFACSHFYLKC